jgi:hypothetical protein
MGTGDNLVPTTIVQTPDGLFPSDNILADATGIMCLTWRSAGSRAADSRGTANAHQQDHYIREHCRQQYTDVVRQCRRGGNFPADSNDIAKLVPQDFLEMMSLADYSAGDIRNKLLGGINSGTFLLNYTGHGNPAMLADEGLLYSTDVSSMQNSGRLFVMSVRPALQECLHCLAMIH